LLAKRLPFYGNLIAQHDAAQGNVTKPSENQPNVTSNVNQPNATQPNENQPNVTQPSENPPVVAQNETQVTPPPPS